MIFSRKKKLQRDRDAGLVFCWRGGQGGNNGGAILALIIASGLFALAFWGINLNFKSAKPSIRKHAKILLLNEYSSEMALWIDQNSPFPSRWDPMTDELYQSRVDGKIEKFFQKITTPPSPWIAMPDSGTLMHRPRIVEKGEVELGNLPSVKWTKNKKGVLELIVEVEPLGDLKKRKPKKFNPLDIIIPEQAYGSTMRFIVEINADGEVQYINPTKWREQEYEIHIENWLMRQKFLPSPKKSTTGLVIVKVGVKNHAGN